MWVGDFAPLSLSLALFLTIEPTVSQIFPRCFWAFCTRYWTSLDSASLKEVQHYVQLCSLYEQVGLDQRHGFKDSPQSKGHDNITNFN